MDITIPNAVACDAVAGSEPLDLIGVGSYWRTPPGQFAVWIEIVNPAERAFTVGLEMYRGSDFLGETEEELVLAGKSHWHGWFAFHGATGFQPKTYHVVVLLDGTPSRTIKLDFGHPEGK